MRTGIPGLFLILLMAACGNGPDKPAGTLLADNKPKPCNSPHRITTITKDDIYDLSGYAHTAGVSPFNLFDEASLSDPKDRFGTEHPKTSPHPRKGINLYFKDGGSRLVVDLRAMHKISEICLYDKSMQTDSIWIYTGTMTNWKLKAAVTTKGNPGFWGWRSFNISDTSRYIMFRFHGPDAEITEAAVYGCPLEELEPLPPLEYTGPRLEPKMMKEFLGVNCYQGTDIRWMKPFYYSRMYTSISRIDVDTVDNWPNIKYFITPNGWWNNGSGDYVMYSDSITRDVGNKIWYAFLGVPKWMENKGLWNEDRPVTKIGMNPEDPMSYARHANMMWTMAACYGTTKVDTALIQSVDPHKFSGRNTMTIYENGNETDAAWGGNKYCNPVSYFAQSTADYDGHEGRMGKTFGIKNADVNSNLMLAGFTSFDVDRLRVLQFLCKTMRKDKQFLWNGGIQYHYYSSNGKGDHPTDIFTSATAGITPEEDSLRQKMAKARNDTYRLQPNVECILGEYGFDKNRKSKVSAPLVPGYSSSESQGLMLLRAINLIAFSGFDRYIIYWIKDDVDENFEEGLFVTSGLLRQKGNFEFLPYPAWFYINSLVHHLGNYIPEKIIQERGDVWIYKYRNKLSPDSAAYFVYCPTRNGKKISNYELQTGGVSASVLSFKDKLAEGILTPLAVQGGKVKLDVGEAPKVVFVKVK